MATPEKWPPLPRDPVTYVSYTGATSYVLAQGLFIDIVTPYVGLKPFEGVSWIRGHHDRDSEEARALMTALAMSRL